MYRCTDCGSKFEYAEIVCEKLGLKEPPYKRIRRCPFCHSGELEEFEANHCHYCGVKLDTQDKYCSQRCKKAGELAFAAEAQRRGEFLSSAVASAVREVTQYNKEHGTKYSYGQYFMLKDTGGLK